MGKEAMERDGNGRSLKVWKRTEMSSETKGGGKERRGRRVYWLEEMREDRAEDECVWGELTMLELSLVLHSPGPALAVSGIPPSILGDTHVHTYRPRGKVSPKVVQSLLMALSLGPHDGQ